MEGNYTNAVAAEVSAQKDGSLYIGIEARRKLGVSYNDNIKVEIPSFGRVVKGAVNSAGSIQAGRDVTSEAFESEECRHSATEHIDAIVRKVTGTWDDDHGLTEERHEKVSHLDSKDL